VNSGNGTPPDGVCCGTDRVRCFEAISISPRGDIATLLALADALGFAGDLDDRSTWFAAGDVFS
jgi:hypothetical protein